MGKKDILERHLQSFNEVFADIINVLLLSGKGPQVKPDDLQDAKVRTLYKSDGELHEQERDIAKLWKRGKVVFCLIGLENQSSIDEDMPVRVFSYEGGDYRIQIAHRDAEIEAARKAGDHEKARKLRRKKFYPVITLVLNYGEKRWRKPKRLLERVSVPEALAPLVNDYHIHVVDVAWLTKKQEKMLTSDFRVVVEYFRQMRIDGEYHPSPQVLKHKDAVLKLLTALTGDRRFDEIRDSFGKGEPVTMVSALDKIEARGVEKGRAEGRAEGRTEGAQREKENFAIRMLEAGKLAIEEIASYSGLTLQKVRALKRAMA